MAARSSFLAYVCASLVGASPITNSGVQDGVLDVASAEADMDSTTSCTTLPIGSIPIRETYITPGNPFFNSKTGMPCFTAPSAAQIATLKLYDCRSAWHRQQHSETDEDVRCSSLMNSFLMSHSDGGVVLGVYSAIFNEEIVDLDGGKMNMDDTFPFAAVPELHTLSFGNKRVEERMDNALDLSRFGWSGRAPELMQPAYNTSYAVQWLMLKRGGAVAPYVQHQVGEWSVEVAAHLSGLSLDKKEDAIQATQFACELWLCLANHAQQGDIGPDNTDWLAAFPFIRRGPPWIHGSHGAQWRLLRGLKDIPGSGFATPSADVWTLTDSLCGGERGADVDFAIYAGCAHGLGHSLAWYVSSGAATAHEVLASTCRKGEAQNDSRLAFNCEAGFFHEFHRAQLWMKPDLGQRFDPYGATKPCELPTSVAHAAHPCFSHMRVEQKKTVMPWWFDFSYGETQDTVVVAHTSTGTESMLGDLGYCIAGPYPGYVDEHQAACVLWFQWWFLYANLIGAANWILPPEDREKVTNFSFVSFDPRPLALAASLDAPEPTDTPRIPRLRITERMNDVGMLLLLCQVGGVRTSFFAWVGCVHSNAPPTKFIADAGVNAVAAGLLVYARPGSRHHRDATKPILDGTEEDEIARMCEERFEASRFDTGTEKQLAFVTQLCTDTARSHGTSLQPLTDLSALKKAYAEFSVDARM